MSELTVEKLREAMRELEKIQGPSVSTGLLYPSLGVSIPIYETPLLVETEEYQETLQLSFWQRWIEPVSTFLNFQTMPFEPWVKSRTVTKSPCSEKGIFGHHRQPLRENGQITLDSVF